MTKAALARKWALQTIGGVQYSAPLDTPKHYSTLFAATENPISEGGAWAQTGAGTGLDWTTPQTAGGIAFGTQTVASPAYTDSIAYLSGFTPNHRVGAHISIATGAVAASTLGHEVELILRGSMAAHTQSHYECNLGFNSTGRLAQIILLNGGLGTYTVLQSYSAGTFVDGDFFEAEIIGTVINTYLNASLLTTYDTVIDPVRLSIGQPGMGFYWNGTENLNDFGLKDYDAIDI